MYPSADGKPFVKVALQPSQQIYVASIYFPDTYPYALPKVFITKPTIGSSPHRYKDDNICYMHPNFWNPGVHHLVFVIGRTAKWLAKYEVWKRKGIWPGQSMAH
jgi:hypothetical protein